MWFLIASTSLPSEARSKCPSNTERSEGQFPLHTFRAKRGAREASKGSSHCRANRRPIPTTYLPREASKGPSNTERSEGQFPLCSFRAKRAKVPPIPSEARCSPLTDNLTNPLYLKACKGPSNTERSEDQFPLRPFRAKRGSHQ